jgi:serine protease AprX
VGANLTKRDASRSRLVWLGLLTLVLATALGMIRAGASWGASGYDPASDPYSMQNITAHDGMRPWWHAGWTGRGVDVALIDTGVVPVPGLDAPGKVVNGPDLSLESQNPSFQHLDTNGHGTFMAGIIGGDDGQPNGYRGVAPDSRLLSVKVGDADGGVDVSQVIAAIDWIVQHRYDNGMNIRVINLSYGTDSTQPYMSDPLAYAAEQAWKAGIVVVVAAGNTGPYSGLSDPAYDPNLISVGAADTMGTPQVSDDEPSSFTSTGRVCNGPKCVAPTLLAPGTHMQSLRDPGSFIDQNSPGGELGDSYFRGSGTSEAAAYVTGVVALLLQRYPDLSPDQVKAMLEAGTQRLRGVPTLLQGSGELNLVKLMQAPVPAYGAGSSLGDHGTLHSRWSTGNGSLEGARGTDHLSMDGITLRGERDIFGQPFNSHTMAGLEASGSSWSAGSWDGSSWSGSSWSGSSWSSANWVGSSWSGSSWSDLDWSGNSWSGSSWSGSSWSGSSWSGSSWSGTDWSSAAWMGHQWLGASWG